jgi:alpha-galactosidase
MPIMYNSWLHSFEWLDVDDLKRQAACAAELGVEVFTIDAGWFGTGENWSLSVGDWVENKNRGTKGRLKELSDYVRGLGMKFGLWFEPERASWESLAYKKYPQYFMSGSPYGALLDFSNAEARKYILDIISEKIKEWNLEFVKFDCNASIPHDPNHSAFYRYHQGHRLFIQELKNRFPDLYISNCAGGGNRMEMAQATYTDSFWFTDNQGPYEGLSIIKETLKRMPTGCIERWNVQKYLEGFPAYSPTLQGRMVSCNNATWDFVLTVSGEYTKAFMTGGPLGFSCDLCSFPDEYKKQWKDFIKRYKADREFYAKATVRILIDTPSIIAIEYADTDFSRCELQLFTKLVYAKDVCVYPAVDKSATYQWNGEMLTGAEIMENGLYVNELLDNNAVCITLQKAKTI